MQKGLAMFTSPIQIGIRQIERWLKAAAQDEDPTIKLLHANYAVADIDLLTQQFSYERIKKESGKNPQELYRTAIKYQDEATAELTRLCPNIVPTY